MKTFKIIALALFSTVIISCDDFLTREPISAISADQFFSTDDGNMVDVVLFKYFSDLRNGIPVVYCEDLFGHDFSDWLSLFHSVLRFDLS